MTMIRRLAGLASGLIAFLGIVAIYDQLTDGSVREFLTNQGLSVLVVLMLYFVVPIGIHVLAIPVSNLYYYTLKPLASGFLRRRGKRILHHNISPDEVLSFIHRAEMRGVLEKEDARLLCTLVRDMEPLEFDILELCDNPNEWAENFGFDYPRWKTAKRVQVIDFALPLFRGKRESYDSHVEKLHYMQLLSISREMLHQAVSGSELLKPMTTPVGRQLAYIIKRVRIQQTS